MTLVEVFEKEGNENVKATCEETETFFENPQHVYSQELLNLMPRFEDISAADYQ